jgi:hypothetical protein
MEPNTKWYYKPVTVVIAILCAGPLALPLVWRSPAFTKRLKIIITILLAILTIVLIKSSIGLYILLLKYVEQLQKAMGA